jgi:hypothetical protein
VRGNTLQVPTPIAPKVIIIVRETMSSSPLLKANIELSLDSCFWNGKYDDAEIIEVVSVSIAVFNLIVAFLSHVF